jgi:hypothetical protein
MRTVGLTFPVEEKKPSKTGKVITTKGGKKKAEKTKEDKEFEEKEK